MSYRYVIAKFTELHFITATVKCNQLLTVINMILKWVLPVVTDFIILNFISWTHDHQDYKCICSFTVPVFYELHTLSKFVLSHTKKYSLYPKNWSSLWLSCDFAWLCQRLKMTYNIVMLLSNWHCCAFIATVSDDFWYIHIYGAV